MKAVGAERNVQLPTTDQFATPETRDAATVILLSDRPDLHVLVLERTRQAVFGPGATVFPGGAVDPADAGELFAGRITGLDDPAASREQRIAHGGLGFRIAALRECFEEAGILLAATRRAGNRSSTTRILRPRAELNAGAVAFGDVLATRDLVFDARELRVFSHWLTPLGAPRRYNTWFFVAPAPDGEEGAHDDNELVASAWMRPARRARAACGR